MSGTVQDSFDGLPGWAKGLIGVAVTGTTIFIAWKVYSSVNDRLKHAGDYKEQDAVKSDLATLQSKNIKPSYSDSQYTTWANQIFAAFDGYGHDTSTVYRVFVQLKNDADVLKLINAYGIREISSGAGNPAPNFKGTLAGSIADQLNTEEVKQLNLMLAKAGIKLKF